MRRCAFVATAVAALVVAGCGSRLPEYALSGATMGTEYNVKLVAPPDGLRMDALRRDLDAALEHVNSLASTYSGDSELSRFNRLQSTDWVTVSAEFCDAIARALEISRSTGGAFDITVGPLVNLWGFGPEGAVFEPPAEDAIAAAAARTGYGKLETRCAAHAVRKTEPDVYVDLSAWAKGYAADRLAALLEGRDIDNFLVEIGGELRVRGHNAARERWAVGVEKPLDTQRAVDTLLHVTDCGVATSGDYRNYFDYRGKRYSHTIDPRNGRPTAHELATVTVIDRSAARADAMATALLVLGPDDGPALAEKLGLAAYFQIRRDGGYVHRASSAFDRMGIR